MMDEEGRQNLSSRGDGLLPQTVLVKPNWSNYTLVSGAIRTIEVNEDKWTKAKAQRDQVYAT